jgi:hypothetical protein
VRIDWLRMQVELSARVVLREGSLELFACSPHTREHESVVAVEGRPWHVYQALGLIGLEPGQPVTYDDRHARWLPATGDRVEIRVRYRTPEGPHVADISDWMINAKTNQRVPPQEWVFCGSRRFGQGTFGADADGTVVCVVDFSTALIGLAEPHSADNALLWVVANTEQIPPQGTQCTLLIRAAGPVLLVDCLGSNRFRVDDQPLDAGGLAALIHERLERDEGLRVTVRALPGGPANAGPEAVETIRAAGARDVRLADPHPPTEASPAKPAASAGRDG